MIQEKTPILKQKFKRRVTTNPIFSNPKQEKEKNPFNKTDTAKVVSLALNKGMGARFKQRLGLPNENKGIKVLPIDGSISDSTKMLSINKAMAELQHNTTITDGMLDGDMVRDSFATFRQIAGYTFDPLGSVPAREQIEPDQIYLDVLKWFAQQCSGFIKSPVSIEITPSSGYSQNIGGSSPNVIGYKLGTVKKFNANVHKIFKKAHASTSNGRFVLDTFEDGVEHAFVEGRRTQQEKIDEVVTDGKIIYQPKLRWVYDCYGNHVQVSRTTPFNNFFSMRSRFVYGGSGTFNYPLSYIGTGWRKYYSSKFPAFFKHDFNKFTAKLKGKRFLLSIDFKNFDQNMHQSYTDTLFRNCDHMHEYAQDYILRLLGIPCFSKNDYKESTGYFIHNLDTPRFFNAYGNPSGITFVADIAKLVGGSVALTLLMVCFNLTYTDLELILKNEHSRFTLFNGGDDNLYAFEFEADKVMFEKFMNKHNIYEGDGVTRRFVKSASGYEILVEATPVFLGHDFVRLNDQITPIQDIRNLASKLLLAEREFGKDKPFWAMGFWLRLELLKNHPYYSRMYEAFNQAVYDNFRTDLETMFYVTSRPQVEDYVNMADVYFMLDPAYIHYRLDPDDISPEILEKVFMSVDPVVFSELDKYVC